MNILKELNRRKRIALLGGGAHTIPSYRALLLSLTKHYDLVVYSEFHIKRDRTSPYKLKSVPSIRLPRRFRELCFFALVFTDVLFGRTDIIHSHSTYPSGLVAILVKMILRTPVIISLDAAEGIGLPDIGFGDLLHRKRTLVNRFVLQRADVVTALTSYHRELVLKNLRIRRKIEVIPRGVDLTRFPYSSRTVGSPVKFLSVAYIHHVKDQEMLLKCFAVLSRRLNATLTMVGMDYLNDRMRTISKDLGVSERVTFEGFVNHERIQGFYQAADFLLFTSRYESQGVVAAEAMASGVLVCGTHVGMLADLDDSCCLTVPPGDHENLARVIFDLLEDPLRMSNLRTNARNWAEKHSLDWTMEQYLDVYKSLLSD